MRQREFLSILLITAAMILLSSCSRLTFIKPDLSRGEYTQVAPEYDISDAQRPAALVARDRLVIAGQHLRDGELAQAEKHARAALKTNPRSDVAHTMLAVIAQRRGNSEAAGQHYARAAELAPGRGANLNNYGTWLCGNGRAAESLAWFDRAVADPAYPTPADALANAGRCAMRAGQVARAEPNLRRAIEIDPNNVVALDSLAKYAFLHGQMLDARAFSQRRLALAPADADALRLASQIEQKLGDMAAADRYTQQLRVEFGDTAPARDGNDRLR